MSRRLSRWIRQGGWVIHPPLVLGTALLLVGVLVPSRLTPPASLAVARAEVNQLQSQVVALGRENQQVEASLRPNPLEIYLVVDTEANRLYLYQGKRLLRAAVVSTGSGKVLANPAGERPWRFETPRGVRRVVGKETNPIWYKPDWAFLEEGLPVPPRRHPARAVRGILGAYALDLGEQVKIHGTLEKDELGQPVSHGCVRVGDEDLEAIYDATPVGARVFLY